MPSVAEHETDSEREQTYKRGFTHGVGRAISAFAHKLDKAEIEQIDVWVKGVLLPWEQDSTPSMKAPDFPKIDR